jgi:GNAT superfamily N-acetyltransferase
MNLTLTAADPTSADATLLIQHLSAELGSCYGDDGAGAFSTQDVQIPRSVFIIAYVDGRPVGCGALKPFSPDTPNIAEVKRMFVEPNRRGQGLSRQILTKLENVALENGYNTIRLETGKKQPEAIGLYKSAGYYQIPCYGQYARQPLSMCFEKKIFKEEEVL